MCGTTCPLDYVHPSCATTPGAADGSTVSEKCVSVCVRAHERRCTACTWAGGHLYTCSVSSRGHARNCPDPGVGVAHSCSWSRVRPEPCVRTCMRLWVGCNLPALHVFSPVNSPPTHQSPREVHSIHVMFARMCACTCVCECTREPQDDKQLLKWAQDGEFIGESTQRRLAHVRA